MTRPCECGLCRPKRLFGFDDGTVGGAPSSRTVSRDREERATLARCLLDAWTIIRPLNPFRFPRVASAGLAEARGEPFHVASSESFFVTAAFESGLVATQPMKI
jgi:hypothetical protein